MTKSGNEVTLFKSTLYTQQFILKTSLTIYYNCHHLLENFESIQLCPTFKNLTPYYLIHTIKMCLLHV